MKKAILFLIILNIVHAEDAADLRLIGPNLYDFSLAGQSAYHLHGQIIKTFTNGLSVQIDLGTIYEFHAQIDRPTPGDPRSMLQALAQFRMTYNNNGTTRRISPGAAWALGLKGESVPVKVTKNIFLVNFQNMPAIGDQIYFSAVPLLNGSWDCGVPFTGDTNQFKFIYQVLPNRIIRLEQPFSKLQTKLQTMSTSASNGVPYYQFLYGKHFLDESNTIGYVWIQKSAGQDYAPAIEFLTNQTK